ncbi:SICA antigen [Plasmodium coatneyi]|uniref:SICA antigen n=1 Tax=Plasmodium coatneyi TaxID=208452 RepID=A0A1B1E1N9_9APIC|nr:SICA antigen [Plasmodium coatneyi]ANQ08880.1 SICA antigen [Plasmodium coatneyi]
MVDPVDDNVDTFFRRKWGIGKGDVYGLFQEFNRQLTADDENGGFTAVCEDVVQGHGVDHGLHECFCKILMRNLVKVTNKDSMYKLNGQEVNVREIGSEDARCDLINLWLLLYMSRYYINEQNINYVFTAITNLEAFFLMKPEECIYTGKFSVNEKEDGVGYREIYKWFRDRGIISTMGQISNKSACNGGSRSDDQRSSTFPKGEHKGLSPEVQDKANKFLEEVRQAKEIVKEVEEELAQQQPPPSPPDEDCSKKGELCARAKCVAKKWMQHRPDKKDDYTDMWQDIQTSVKELAEAIPKKNEKVDNYCYGDQWNGKVVTFAEMEACRLIVRGLHHIYKIPKDEDGSQENQEVNNQLFKQTMLCVVMNAYADLLKDKFKDGCSVQKGITQAFSKSTKIKKETNECKGDNNCEVCSKEDYKDCVIGSDKIEKKVKEMLDQNQQIKKTMEEICKDCSKEKDLCERTKCVTINWFRDRLTNQGTGRRDWCVFWGVGDVGRVLKKLSEAMRNESKTDGDLCEKFTGAGDNGVTDPGKKACQYITRGLEYIYIIQEDETQRYGNQKKNNRIFDQTIGCILLNSYADRLEEKGTSCGITEEKIRKMFEEGNKKRDVWCVDESKGGIDCVECTRKPNLSCTLSVDASLWFTSSSCKNKGNHDIKDKVQGMLDNDESKKSEVKQALTEINNICPEPTPATPDPPPGSSAAGFGEGDNAVLKAPKAARLINKIDNPVLPYLPLAPAVLGISIMTYSLWKYFGMLRKTRKRYRRAYQVRAPSLEQQIVDHVDDQADGPHEYYLVKEHKPRSTPIKRRKKRAADRLRGGAVRRRMIIDIHLEVLDECQKGHLHSTKEDFFEILVQEFMGSQFIEEENVSKEDVPSSDSGFMEEDIVSEIGVPKEQVPSFRFRV